MESSIFKIFAQVAGLGGLFLGVFFLLFREVIRKNIFSKLTKAQSYKTIRLILITTWLFAIFGISVWIFSNTNKVQKPADTANIIVVNNYNNYYSNDTTIGISQLSIEAVDKWIEKKVFEGAETFSACANKEAVYAEFKNTSKFTKEIRFYDIDWGDSSEKIHLEIWDFAAPIGHQFSRQGNFIISIHATDVTGKIYNKKYNFFNGSPPRAAFATDRSTMGLKVGQKLNFKLLNVDTNAPWTSYELSLNDGSQPLIHRHTPAPSIISYTLKKSGNFIATLRVINPCFEYTSTLDQIRVSE